MTRVSPLLGGTLQVEDDLVEEMHQYILDAWKQQESPLIIACQWGVDPRLLSRLLADSAGEWMYATAHVSLTKSCLPSLALALFFFLHLLP